MKRKIFSLAAASLAAAIFMSSTAFAAQSKYFVDVNDDNYGWAVDYIDYLCEKGIANGVGDNKYSPEVPIERGDFMVLINKAFYMAPVQGLSVYFSDVDEDDYYYQAIVNAKGNSVITDSGAFYPETPITRSDAMLILYRVMNLNNLIKTTGSTDLSMYTDGDIIKDVEVKNAIGTLTKMGIISGSSGYLNPLNTMTRAEMAVVFTKALQYVDENTVVTTESSTSTTADTDDTDEVESTGIAFTSDDTLTEALVLDGDPYVAADGIAMQFKGTADEGAAVVVKNKVDAVINNANISVSSNSVNGVNVTGSSSAKIDDSIIKAVGSSGSAVRVDETSSVSIDGSELQGAQEKGYALKNENEAEVINSIITNSNGNAVNLIDDSKTTIDNTTFNTNKSENVFYISTTSPLGANNMGELTLTNSVINASGATLFKVDTNDFKVTMENCTIESLKNLLDSTYSYQKTNTYANDIEINLVNQKVNANVYSDDISNVVINLTKGSYLNGKINENNYAEYIEINIEHGSTLELQDDAYISVLTVEDLSFIDIKDNSYNIYYDDDLDANDWLNGKTFSLQNGGEIRPY